MNHSISLLTSKADCDIMLEMCDTQQGLLYQKKRGTEQALQSTESNTINTGEDLILIGKELVKAQHSLDTLPEGPAKEEARLNVKKYEYTQLLLEQKKEKYALFPLLFKELDVTNLESSVANLEAYIEDVKRRKEEVN